MTARFGAVLTAMVTPFDEDARLDADAAVALAKWLVDNGNDGLVVTGTTGEATALSDAEKADMWRAVSEAVTVPVLAGAGSNDTAHSVELVKAAEQCGVAGILAVTPYYSRPSQAGIEAHFRALAGATSLPTLLYDIPVRTGRKIANDTLLRLAREVPNIVGVKDAASDLNGTAWLRAEAPDGFEVYSGEDGITLPLLSVGAVGTISVASHWTASLQGEMLAAFFKGDLDTARRINARLLPSFAYETGDAAPNPIPSKAMLRTLGLKVGECRLPMGPAPAGLEDRAREILADLGEDAPKPFRLV
ncbi:MAG: 4-hydroxy-tetrahydrodipicolinate synthase [Actinomycetota bacterium]|nr:4-hydroxy-tetrahydrodipicolinate synthase [Actinomycetota bacterium]